jgi:hypothetical protein
VSWFAYAIVLACGLAWWLTDRQDRKENTDPWEDSDALQ